MKTYFENDPDKQTYKRKHKIKYKFSISQIIEKQLIERITNESIEEVLK
jgi:hypothetical protein